jgi:hypothetical protein
MARRRETVAIRDPIEKLTEEVGRNVQAETDLVHERAMSQAGAKFKPAPARGR